VQNHAGIIVDLSMKMAFSRIRDAIKNTDSGDAERKLIAILREIVSVPHVRRRELSSGGHAKDARTPRQHI